MDTAIRPHSESHPNERNVGRVLSILWVAEVAFVAAAAIGSVVGGEQFANLVWLPLIGLGAYPILQWERIAALVMVPFVLAGAIVIVVSAKMQTSVDMQGVMFVVLPAFVIPGILGAALLLHSERR